MADERQDEASKKPETSTPAAQPQENPYANFVVPAPLLTIPATGPRIPTPPRGGFRRGTHVGIAYLPEARNVPGLPQTWEGYVPPSSPQAESSPAAAESLSSLDNAFSQLQVEANPEAVESQPSPGSVSSPPQAKNSPETAPPAPAHAPPTIPKELDDDTPRPIHVYRGQALGWFDVEQHIDPTHDVAYANPSEYIVFDPAPELDPEAAVFQPGAESSATGTSLRGDAPVFVPGAVEAAFGEDLHLTNVVAEVRATSPSLGRDEAVRTITDHLQADPDFLSMVLDLSANLDQPISAVDATTYGGMVYRRLRELPEFLDVCARMVDGYDSKNGDKSAAGSQGKTPRVPEGPTFKRGLSSMPAGPTAADGSAAFPRSAAPSPEAQAGASQAGASQAGLSQPGLHQPGPSQAGLSQAGASQPGASQPHTTPPTHRAAQEVTPPSHPSSNHPASGSSPAQPLIRRLSRRASQLGDRARGGVRRRIQRIRDGVHDLNCATGAQDEDSDERAPRQAKGDRPQ
ncbi:hypothetical protein F5Y18DRAFT_211923 [Xylariaceae sp. FL1019]|nr:hypothetical protein F5Y18DRAFT_211923 [Xylariaceae sp. FL1019]